MKEDDSAEGEWVEERPSVEDKVNPLRSSNEPTPTSSSSSSTTEAEREQGYKLRFSEGQTPVFEMITPKSQKKSKSKSGSMSKARSIASEAEEWSYSDVGGSKEASSRRTEEEEQEEEVGGWRSYFSGRCLIKFYLLTIFSTWVIFAACVNFDREDYASRCVLPWVVVDTLIIAYYGGGLVWRLLRVSERMEEFRERHPMPWADMAREYVCRFFETGSRLLIVPLAGWIVYDAWQSSIRLRSIVAVLAYVAIAVVCSANPARIKWKPVFGAFTLQLGVGITLLRWSTGREKLVLVSNQVVYFLDYTANGTAVVYEWIAFPPHICGFGFVFLYTAMQIIIYFGGIVSLLYYYGIIQAVLAKFAIVMQYTLGTTVIESTNAVACIFLGQTESAVLIGPAFDTMTSSEITTVMCSGFACIAGALFSAYISFGACPEYLLSATVMSASVSLGIAKILYPEIQVSSQKSVEDMKLAKHEYHSFLDAISQGAIGAARVVGAIGMSLVVYLSLLKCVNHSVMWITQRLGYEDTSFNSLVGLTFYPLAWMMGASDAEDPQATTVPQEKSIIYRAPQVNRDETLKVAELMGIKTTVNEFVAYSALAEMIQSGTLKGARAQMVATYALCGFSNIASIGTVLGTMGAMCPRRMKVFSKLALRGLLGGCISCFLTASVAGILVEQPTSCQPKVFNACLNLTTLKGHLDQRYGLI
ncbi:hypothetical protein PRIPAC_92004 [Pristionchus pacificus]|uniref:Uncharacterized protein n=1 Tax=Pristionchus pacificus TaxID=54126 RepID=A0A2A6BAJ5_PRIPA|nr:hypothetical protein PRIPAC_92004 [Pristionchus pacificus]|eukprot:PDM62898.1 hypothetical protein PRIPAC_50113 [Pristionchus pacificus]